MLSENMKDLEQQRDFIVVLARVWARDKHNLSGDWVSETDEAYLLSAVETYENCLEAYAHNDQV